MAGPASATRRDGSWRSWSRSRREYVPPAVIALALETLDDEERTLDWL